ncbi:MAG: transglycosylase domain-containing protein [Candidatus Eisenbacteria bacterium]
MSLQLRRFFTPARLLIFFAIAALVLIGSGIQFARKVFALRDQRAAGPNWSFPSRVYSNGVPLVINAVASVAYLKSELAARQYVEEPSLSMTPGRYTRAPDGFDIVLRGFLDEPDPEGGAGPERVIVRTFGGHIVGVERLGGLPGAPAPDLEHPPRLEPMLVSMLFDDERMWRTRVSLERIPPAVRQAILTSEDRRFYRHIGVDARSALRALTVNVREGDVRQGGSTVTQQLARGLFLGRERTLFRKLAEVPIALGLEILLSKDQILEMYLSSIYWGQAQGYSIGGIAAAARWYFDAPVESLSVIQGATLAAMIPAPNVFDPFEAPERVRGRRDALLKAMEEAGHLPRGEAARLAATPLRTRRGKTPTERFPSYSGYVNHVLDDLLRSGAGTHYGLAVFTMMDLAWQEHAEDAMESGLAALDRSGRRRTRLEGAFVALEPSRSAVLAMVGGRAAETGNFNRAYQALRQPGSAIKPFVYAAAFESPQGFTPATTIADTQRTFGRGRRAWRPRNFSGNYHAEVTLAKALESSLNVATANLVELVGPHTVADVAGRFGLGKLKPVLSIGLGSNEVTLLQMTNGFAAFAARGMVRQPSPLRVVLDRRGRVVARPSEEATQAVSPGTATLMMALLQNVVRYGVASPLRTVYGFDRPVGGKTGTSNDFHDAWFVGLTPHVAAGVWVGHDRPRSIGRQAAHTALPLWARAVSRMIEGFPPTPFLDDTSLEWADINPWRGCLADSSSDSTYVAETTPFLLGTAPTYGCSLEALYDYESLDYESEFRDYESGSDSTSGEGADSSSFRMESIDTLETNSNPEPEDEPR